MDMSFFKEIFFCLSRQGPGLTRSTLKALSVVPKLTKESNVLDIGCGSGFQTMDLLRAQPGKILATDNYAPALERLEKQAAEEGFFQRLETLCVDMTVLDFDSKRFFDLIWCEGAIFVIGFAEGLKKWKNFLVPDGYLALTELSWFEDNPPQELKDYWNATYPSIKTIDQHLDIISQSGFDAVEHFKLPQEAWLEAFYTPLKSRIEDFRKPAEGKPEKQAVIDWIDKEIKMYETYGRYYGYTFYILKQKS